MFEYTNKRVRSAVTTLDGADKRNALNKYILGTVHLSEIGRNDKGRPMSAAEVSAEFGAGTTSATGATSLGKYRMAGEFVKPYAEDSENWEETVRAVMSATLTALGRTRAQGQIAPKKADLRDIFENAAILVTEGQDRVSAFTDALAQWDLAVSHEEASRNGKDSEEDSEEDGPVSGDSRGDTLATGDAGDMTRAEALTAAVRLLQIAADGITPTEAALHAGLIEKAFDVVGDLFSAAQN